MFGHITNLGHRRTLMEAVGFYLFFTILLVGLSTFIGHYMGVVGLLEGTVGGFFEGGGIHTLIGTGWVLLLSGMILSHKKLTSDLMAVIVTLIGVYLAYTTNVMLGMIIVSYLTTLDTVKK